MKIGLDMDDTITYAPEFFRRLTNDLKHAEIQIVSARCSPDDPQYDQIHRETVQELESLGIRFDKLALVGPRNKVKYIEANGIDIMFDDTDEEIVGCPKSCVVFKIREEMNFCWESKRWLHSDKTSVAL